MKKQTQMLDGKEREEPEDAGDDAGDAKTSAAKYVIKQLPSVSIILNTNHFEVEVIGNDVQQCAGIAFEATQRFSGRKLPPPDKRSEIG